MGGIYYGVENNKSAFRVLFDLMKTKPLWIDETGAEPLMSAAMINGWADGLSARVTSETSAFLPPHLFNLLGPNLASRFLELSDRVCTKIP